MPDLNDPLSDRELDVLRAVAKGDANKQIAVALDISPNTVKVHLRNVFTKLGASSRTEASMIAVERGLIPNPAGENAKGDAHEERAAEIEVAPLLPPPEAAVQNGRFPWFNLRFAAFTVITLLVVALAAALARPVFDDAPAALPTPLPDTPIDENWTEAQAMPVPNAGMAMAAVGLRVYQIGGETASGIVGNVTVYDTVSRMWETGAAKPTAVSEAAAAVLFGEIYVVGGRTVDQRPTAIVEAYSPANDAWRNIASLPQPIAGGVAVSDGSFLYLFGGWDGSDYLADAYLYDTEANTWRLLPAMATPRAYAAGANVAGLLYVVGGRDDTQALAACEFLDPMALVWEACPEMAQARAGGQAVSLINKLFVFGGGDVLGETAVGFSEVYEPRDQTWQLINMPMLNTIDGWEGLGAAPVETSIYVGGGRFDERMSDRQYIYNPLSFRTYLPAASSGENQ